MFGINKKLTKNKPDAINKKSQVGKEVGKSKAVVPDLICKVKIFQNFKTSKNYTIT